MTTISQVVAAQKAFSKYGTQVEASRQYLTAQRGLMVQASVSALVPLAVIQHFGSVVTILNQLAAVPGVAAYAQTQATDPTYDVALEFTSIRNAMVNARDSLIAAFPKDANGFILYQTINPDGTLAIRTFTAAQLTAAVALVDSVIALLS